MTRPDDAERDARLLAALRHAPDRDAAPPDGVSQRILAQARQAARPAAAAASPGWLERWFGWMSRPVAAGAFGTVLIAGFVGLMWRGGPPPEAMPGHEREQPPAAAPAAPPAPPAAPAAERRAREAAPPAADRAKTEPPRRSSGDAASTEAPAAKAAERVETPAAAPAAAPAAEPAPAAAPAPLPAPMPAPAPAPARPSPFPGATDNAAPRSPPAAPAAAPPPAAAAPAPAQNRSTLGSSGLVAPAFDPLATALAAADGTTRDRLLALRQRVRGGWTPWPTAPAEPGEPVVDSAGRALGRLWVDAGQAVWQTADGRVWRATLAAPNSPP